MLHVKALLVSLAVEHLCMCIACANVLMYDRIVCLCALATVCCTAT
jgi:hypothetical protein